MNGLRALTAAHQSLWQIGQASWSVDQDAGRIMFVSPRTKKGDGAKKGDGGQKKGTGVILSSGQRNGTGEDALTQALEPGGTLAFDYVDGADSLTAITQYRARRDLTSAELALLVDYTMGQWSDGIGENWSSESASRYGYAIMCLTQVDFPTNGGRGGEPA